MRRRRFIEHASFVVVIQALHLNFFTSCQVSVDKKLTKKTGKAIRNRIDDLLPNDQVNPKKPRLAESVNDSTLISADSKLNKSTTDLLNGGDGNILVLYFIIFLNADLICTVNVIIDEFDQFDARNLLTKVLSFLDVRK